MSNRVYHVLKRRSENKVHQKWIFTDKSGNNPRKHSTIAIRRAIENAGVEDFRVHDFRHTCASRLVQNGMAVQEITHILGQINTVTTITMRFIYLEQNKVVEKVE